MRGTGTGILGGLLAVSLAAALLGAADVGGNPQRAPSATRPNIVAIETDDQTLEEMKVMERTQRLLGDEGVTFDNSFVSFSLCCPSRATFLTGQYAHNHGVESNGLPTGGYYKLDNTNTLPVWLRRAGYVTVHVGKYLNAYGKQDPTEIPPGWVDWHGSIDPWTYNYYSYELNDNGHVSLYCPDDTPPCYQTDVYAQLGVDAIRRHAPDAAPFFLWLAFLAPHAGAPNEPDDPVKLGLPTPLPAARHKHYFGGTELPLAPSFNEADVSDKPAQIRALRRISAVYALGIRTNYQQELESLLAVDEAVAKIVDALRATGELDRTLIVFTSDNGFFHGEHRIGFGKIFPYEPSIRVPLIIRGPGVPKGVHRSQLVANIDLAPTILDAAHVSAGRVMDGRTLFPLIRDGRKEYGRDLLIENGPGAGHFAGIRTQHFFYADYASGDHELYDLANDPDELESLHDDPRYASIRAELAQRLVGLRACKGAVCNERPAGDFTVRSKRIGEGRCLGGPLTLSVSSAPRIMRVDYSMNGRPVASAVRRPFRVVLAGTRVPHGLAHARARLSAFGDQVVTLDMRFRAC